MNLVLNFIRPNIGQGVQAFRDGTLRDSISIGASGDDVTGDDQVVVGRKYVNSNQDYAHVEVDELIFFNKALMQQEVTELYNLYQ